MRMFRRRGLSYLTKDDIKRACACSDAIKSAYEAFRKSRPYQTIEDMWENAHMMGYMREAIILFGDSEFHYEERDDETKTWVERRKDYAR